jgi:hypothetical protein
MVLFVKSVFEPETRRSPESFEKRSDKDLRNRRVFARLRAEATKE